MKESLYRWSDFKGIYKDTLADFEELLIVLLSLESGRNEWLQGACFDRVAQ